MNRQRQQLTDLYVHSLHSVTVHPPAKVVKLYQLFRSAPSSFLLHPHMKYCSSLCLSLSLAGCWFNLPEEDRQRTLLLAHSLEPGEYILDCSIHNVQSVWTRPFIHLHTGSNGKFGGESKFLPSESVSLPVNLPVRVTTGWEREATRGTRRRRKRKRALASVEAEKYKCQRRIFDVAWLEWQETGHGHHVELKVHFIGRWERERGQREEVCTWLVSRKRERTVLASLTGSLDWPRKLAQRFKQRAREQKRKPGCEEREKRRKRHKNRQEWMQSGKSLPASQQIFSSLKDRAT